MIAIVANVADESTLPLPIATDVALVRKVLRKAQLMDSHNGLPWQFRQLHSDLSAETCGAAGLQQGQMAEDHRLNLLRMVGKANRSRSKRRAGRRSSAPRR